MSEIVEVTQADRDAARAFLGDAVFRVSSTGRALSEAFARHRIAAEARSHDGEWEAMREAFNEALWAGWRSGLAGEQMDDNHAAKAWAASDAAAKASALPLFDEGRL